MRSAIAFPLAFAIGAGATSGLIELAVAVQKQGISGYLVFLGLLALLAMAGLVFDILRGRARRN